LFNSGSRKVLVTCFDTVTAKRRTMGHRSVRSPDNHIDILNRLNWGRSPYSTPARVKLSSHASTSLVRTPSKGLESALEWGSESVSVLVLVSAWNWRARRLRRRRCWRVAHRAARHLVIEDNESTSTRVAGRLKQVGLRWLLRILQQRRDGTVGLHRRRLLARPVNGRERLRRVGRLRRRHRCACWSSRRTRVLRLGAWQLRLQPAPLLEELGVDRLVR